MTETTAAVQTATVPQQSPNDVLASEVTEALVAAGLIKDSHRGTLLANLKTGGVKQEDWNLWIDIATAPQVSHGEGDNE